MEDNRKSDGASIPIDWRELPLAPVGEDAESALDKLLAKLGSAPQAGEYNHEKLRILFEEAFSPEDFAKARMNADLVPLPVGALLPCQQGIDVIGSLDEVLKGGEDIEPFFQTPITNSAPVVTYMGVFILEGHRRWLKAYLINPHACINAANYSYSEGAPWRLLRNYQRLIAEAGADGSPSEETNVFAMEKQAARDYIEQAMADSLVESLSAHVGKVHDRKTAIDYLLRNISNLRCYNKPMLFAP